MVQTQRKTDEQRLVNACGSDDTLHFLLASDNHPLAIQRVYQLAQELELDWDFMTWGSAQWSNALMRQCWAKAGIFVQDPLFEE